MLVTALTASPLPGPDTGSADQLSNPTVSLESKEGGWNGKEFKRPQNRLALICQPFYHAPQRRDDALESINPVPYKHISVEAFDPTDETHKCNTVTPKPPN